MNIVNQPRRSKLGDILKELLEKTGEDKFDKFYVLVAYVKKSGVSRLKPSILIFKGNGSQVKSIAGIDQKQSSKQGIKMLFELSDEMYIYHNRRLSSTFHPKLYIFEKADQKAVVFIGSSNLTCGGLYTNYEMNSILELDLTQEGDREKFNEIKGVFDSYCDTSLGCCKKLTEEFIQTLIDRGKLSDEDANSIARAAAGASEEDSEGELLFGTENFTAPTVEDETEEEPTQTIGTPPSASTPPPTVSQQVIQQTTRGQTTIPNITQPTITGTNLGFWKKLSNYDASQTSSPGQIQIPIRFLGYFPQFSPFTHTGANASQAEVYFNVIYEDENGQRRTVNNVRAIHYVPAANHPRPNAEIRFTFHNRSISNTFNARDILEFRRTNNPNIWFIIKMIRDGSHTHTNLTQNGQKFNTI
ncbi:phospholipase D family protein [Candidatus Woesearchaeota archaeon]|nr:phospholipase D family protein [Candidatus Woesearchaeota archaeon]